MLLTDLGARTIKVEPPASGEGHAPAAGARPRLRARRHGAYFLTLNRSKQQRLHRPEETAGPRGVPDLVRHADVVFDNFSVGVPRRLGIDHEPGGGQPAHRHLLGHRLRRDRPRHAAAGLRPGWCRPWAAACPSPACRAGPHAQRHPHRRPGRRRRIGALGVMAALVERERTGRGQHVDVSMLDVQISLLNHTATMHLMSGIVPGRMGNGHFLHVPYNAFATADGHVIVACIGDPSSRLRADHRHPLSCWKRSTASSPRAMPTNRHRARRGRGTGAARHPTGGAAARSGASPAAR